MKHVLGSLQELKVHDRMLFSLKIVPRALTGLELQKIEKKAADVAAAIEWAKKNSVSAFIHSLFLYSVKLMYLHQIATDLTEYVAVAVVAAARVGKCGEGRGVRE